MTQPHPMGLGEPEVVGKQALFQPPKHENKKLVPKEKEYSPKEPEKRFRMTMEITRSALVTIQQIQNRHRLLTGQVLPKWKILDEALSQYTGKKFKKYENTDQ